MSDVLPGFDPPPPPVDAPKAERIPQAERRDVKPVRMPLANNGKTCGDCRFLREKHAGAGKWWKCGTPDPRSKNHRGDGRDMTKRWPACIAFQPKEANSS
jgi:hypothetical protein